MDTETNNNRPLRKAAAVIGLLAVLVLIAWLSITMVKNVPGSFASLASLAESVRSFDATQLENTDDEETTPRFSKDMLVVTSDTNVIKTKSDVRLSWTDASMPGSFVFSYKCTDGVSAVIIETDGVRNINCDTNYNLGSINNMILNVTSENMRFADVPYTLGFIPTNQTQPSASTKGVVTVVNEDIPVLLSKESDTVDETSPTTEVAEEARPSVTESATPVETTPTVTATTPVAKEVFTQEFTYAIPVSDPNGRVDLAVKLMGVGSITNYTFVPGLLQQGKSGAIQFEVRNLGTKTSADWTYTATLPTIGVIESDLQKPLKPNERALITIGFPATETSVFTFKVSIDEDNDNVSLNNRFIETVSLN